MNGNEPAMSYKRFGRTYNELAFKHDIKLAVISRLRFLILMTLLSIARILALNTNNDH